MSTPVEQIKERLSIIDVVGSYVALQKAGKSYKGKSPFTNERTPSFYVSPDRGMYYCFSSSKGGDIFTFIQEMEGVDFRGALKILAERAGVELIPLDPKTKDDREKLFSLLEDTTNYYIAELKRAPEVLEYLKGRGVKEETIEAWRIGFAPAGWRNLKDFLVKKGYSEELIFKAGLVKRPEDGKKESYDVFRDRVMFPIADSSGRVVGFSGRTFSKDPAAPKYVNSPETELYQKSKVLFGYHKAKNGIRNLDFSLVVEGQFDLVLSHQAGYTNTVALSGTALSLEHTELLQRLSNRIVLALDADKAGVGSVKRGATVMLRRGMDVKVARILGGKDPADLVKEDPKLLKHSVGGATHVIEFLLAVIRAEAKDDRNFKLRVREEVLPFIALMPNRIDQEHFETVVAEALAVSHDAIRHEVARMTDSTSGEGVRELPKSQAAPAETHKRAEDILEHLLGVLLWQRQDGEPLLDAKVLEARLETILGPTSMQDLLDWPPEKQSAAIFKAESVYTEGAKGLKEELGRLLYELEVITLRQRLQEAKEALKRAEASGDKEEGRAALAAANTVSAQLKEVMAREPNFS